MSFIKIYKNNISNSLEKLDEKNKSNSFTSKKLRKKGRLFIIGVGGSAEMPHAVNDFRKLCNIDVYTPVDNISESAKTNDEGFETIFDSYLKLTNFCKKIF